MKRLWSSVVDHSAFWLIVFLAYVVVWFLRGRWQVRAFWWSLLRGDDRDR